MTNKLSVNEEYFFHWAPAMSYILGFWFADGSLENSISIRGHYIRVGSTDRDVLSFIKQQLCSEHKIYLYERHPHKNYYLLRIGNKTLYRSLINHGILERKSHSMRFPNIPKEFFSHYLRGYFDGDGCVYLEKGASGKYKRLTTIFTSGSYEYLDQLQRVLFEALQIPIRAIAVTKSGSGARAFQLRYSSRDSLKLYFFMYKDGENLFCLRRKKLLFEKYLCAKHITPEKLTQIYNSKGPIKVWSSS